MWYGYVSEHHINTELKIIYVVTLPCETAEKATEELEKATNKMLHSMNNNIRKLFLIRFYGNQQGAVKLPDTENLIKDGCLGVKIILDK